MNEIVRYLFFVSVRYFKRSALFFSIELFALFVNDLKINVSLRSLTEGSVNSQKLPFFNGTLPSPRCSGYTRIQGN